MQGVSQSNSKNGMYMQGNKSLEDEKTHGGRNAGTFESEEEQAKRRMRQEKYHKE